MLPLLPTERDQRSGEEPIFVEEKLGDGSIRYHMNEKLRRRAEAAVTRISAETITNFERRVLEAMRTGQF